jgi:hypothetical protein
MDAEEARLLEDIQKRRAELITRAQTVKRSVVETFDPREHFKRSPVTGLLTSLSAGVFLGRMMMGRSSHANGEVGAAPPPEEEPSTLASLAMGILPSLLPTVLPALVRPLISLVLPTRPKRARKTNSKSVPQA